MNVGNQIGIWLAVGAGVVDDVDAGALTAALVPVAISSSAGKEVNIWVTRAAVKAPASTSSTTPAPTDTPILFYPIRLSTFISS
jgi:hypothetical protein